MATQPVSHSGAAYSQSGVSREVALRSLGASGLSPFPTLLASGARRPLSVAGALAPSGLLRDVAARPLSIPFSLYVSHGLVSLLNLRLLSRPFDGYVGATVIRRNAARLLSEGYVLFLAPPPAPPVDTTPPAVGNFNPAPGTPISKNTSIAFDVTEDSGYLQRVFVVAFFASTGVAEVIHDGDAFRGYYAASSARTMIASGFRYTVLRSGGWPAAPTIQTFAIDRAGNEAN